MTFFQSIHAHPKIRVSLLFSISALMCAVSQAAEYPECRSDWDQTSAWAVKADAAALTTGTVLATASASMRTVSTFPAASGEFSVHLGRLSAQGYDTATDSVPVKGVPGVGLRLKWGGVSSPGGFKTLTTASIGTPIATALFQAAHGFMQMAVNEVLDTSISFELVITDVDSYVGGVANIQQPGSLVTQVEFDTSNPTGGLGTCTGPWGLWPPVPPDSLQVATLPKVPAPTCEFDTATLNQTVELPGVPSSSVASGGSARSAGMSGEKRFSINAKNCAAGAVFNLYFTDANANGSVDDFLRQANNSDVGIRIYYDNAVNPVAFGPAPIGSTVPERAPITLGSPAAEKGVNYAIPFTAQYVRVPGASGKAFVGDVGAKAKVTVVYP